MRHWEGVRDVIEDDQEGRAESGPEVQRPSCPPNAHHSDDGEQGAPFTKAVELVAAQAHVIDGPDPLGHPMLSPWTSVFGAF